LSHINNLSFENLLKIYPIINAKIEAILALDHFLTHLSPFLANKN
tara:strand:- start:204 stop:338 length:135 start_codon:yes stop_codon:yes gene_type:complete